MAQVKSLSKGVEIKSESKGEVSAVFSTFNVIDSDGDVTFPGAFTDGEEVVISGYAHSIWKGDVPVGEGTIRTTRSEAILDGRFFMDTTAGRETFATVKAMRGKQQWSYGFDVLHAPEQVTFRGQKANALRKLKVHEVSPVWRGAGINTRTLAVKSLVDAGMNPEEAARLVKETPLVSEYKAAIRPHETPVTVKAWDSLAEPEHLGRDVGGDLTIDQLRSVYAWVDPAGDPAMKGSYGFLHHHGLAGEANLRACLAGIADLNGTKGASMPAEQRQAVYAHLAQHLDDGDRDVPELKQAPGEGNLKFPEEAADVLARLSSLRARTSEVMALRRSKGKALSAQSLDILDWLYDEMRGLRTLLDSPQEIADEEMARFVALTYTDLGETA